MLIKAHMTQDPITIQGTVSIREEKRGHHL